MADCLAASNAATFKLMKRASGAANTLDDAVVKSLQRVPALMTRSASGASALAAVVPVAPIAPVAHGWPKSSEPLPACVSATGMPVRSALASSAVASL